MLPAAWRDKSPILGVVHLRPLLGSPGYAGSREEVLRAAQEDASNLVEGGVDGVILENFGDAPFHPGRVPAETVAHLSTIAASLRPRIPMPLGINVLRNDGVAALAVAAAVGAEFIRVNVLCGARVADQGILQGIAHRLQRARVRLHAQGVAVLADVNVKHSAPLAPYDPVQEVHDVLHRGGADAVIVTGSGTGHPVDPEELRTVREAAGGAPVFVGSGLTPDTARDLLAGADGAIVGTAFQRDGAVDPDRVRQLLTAART